MTSFPKDADEVQSKSVPAEDAFAAAIPSIERAATWLTDHLDDCPRPIIPYIKQAYGLRNIDAVEAIRLARLRREAGA